MLGHRGIPYLTEIYISLHVLMQGRRREGYVISMGERRTAYKIVVGSRRERNQFGDVYIVHVDIKWILKKQFMKMSIV
jgi:hypothetical protein